MVGLRLNVLFGGGVGLDAVESYGALAREMGWHLQFLLDARELPPIAGRLGRGCRCRWSFDHMGHMPTSAGVDHPGFQALLGLVRDGNWVKLSGAFRDSVTGPPYADTIPFARALNDAAPERCLWGSDWPHVAAWDGPPRTATLLDLLADWVPDEARRRMRASSTIRGGSTDSDRLRPGRRRVQTRRSTLWPCPGGAGGPALAALCAVSATSPATALSAASCCRATAMPICWFWDAPSIWTAAAARAGPCRRS